MTNSSLNLFIFFNRQVELLRDNLRKITLTLISTSTNRTRLIVYNASIGTEDNEYNAGVPILMHQQS